MNLKTQCTVYQNAEQYEKEFIENVESCKNEMKESFGEYNNNNVIVCAPGKFKCSIQIFKVFFMYTPITLKVE
jgi:hypothetical protein